MERLTVKRKDGRWALANSANMSQVEMMDKIPLAKNRLAAYEDAEEHGLLVWLPVKSGDTVYQLRDKKHALGVGVHPRHISCVCVYGNDWIAIHQGDKPCTKKDLGKTWFLSREEAEAALAKEET